MRIAVVTDIHGNLVALEAVARELDKNAPDLVLHGGDLAMIGPRPAEVLEFVRRKGWLGVLGNTDEMLYDSTMRGDQLAKARKLKPWLDALFDDLLPWAREALSDGHLAWLKGLPRHYRVDQMTLVHASPHDVWRAPMPDATDEELAGVYAELGSPIAAYGHIHRPFIRKLSDLIVANAGSVGLPYDGDPRASYLMIDDREMVIRRVEYDLERARQDAVETGFPFPSWLAQVQGQARFRVP